ncbi:uncharacterized protein LOC107610185 isoform X1 [Arachis ipaensis]|nr:uncharacterized protein LOC107610185 isoform X1 [Arachis ipaensis]
MSCFFNLGRKHAMSLTLENGDFYYNYEQGSSDTTLGESGFSDLPSFLPYRVTVRQFSENNDHDKLRRWFERQLECTIYDKNIFLRMNFLDSSQKRIISDCYELNLASWLKTKSILKDNWDASSWWKTIKEDFMLIFKPIFEGLKKLHLQRQYHGNLTLTYGIKVKKCDTQVCGILTDMVEQDGRADLDRMLSTDVQMLQLIIEQVVKFPNQQYCIPAEVDELCFRQLELHTRQYALRIEWALDPVLFWNVNRRINFLEALQWLFYPHGQTPNDEIILCSQFRKWDYNHNDACLTEVYKKSIRSKAKIFDDDYSVLTFYRNCIQHGNFNKWKEANSPEELHETFMRYYNLLLPSIETMNAILALENPSGRMKVLVWSLAYQIDLVT